MTPKEAAADYIARGWYPVPLEPKSKQCLSAHKDWLSRIYTADDFKDEHNVGIKSVGGLVDIDCDCAEAVFMAEAFLPKTKAVYGRPSRPNSHWLYRCADIKVPVAHKDLILKKNIIEIRVNHQSMAPPSTHPEGELVSWAYVDPTELEVTDKLLIRSVQLVSTASMVARHYNAPGDRHDWGVALAGFFRRLNITEAEATLVFDRAGKWAKDDKVKDRLDAVRTTYSISEDVPSTGAKRLEELMESGKEFVQTIYKIWGSDGGGVSNSRLEEMNAKHAVLFNQAGDLIVMTETVEDGMFQLRFSDPGKMGLLYPQPVQVGVTGNGKPIMKPLGNAWLTHPKRRFYRGIELAPNGITNEGYYNMWRGFAVEPKKGDCQLFKRHIMLLANGNKEHARYIWTWMADAVQRPERPSGIALAFKGKQGTGKSTFAKWFGALFGPHFLHLDSEHRLLGNFNAHLHNAIVILADEAVWAGGKVGLGALKRMITEQTLAIERKGMDIINVKNMLHMMVASNEDWFVPLGFDDRRFAVFEVSDEHRNNWSFFESVRKQLFEEGGLSALLWDLQHHKIDLELRLIPSTDERDRQKKQSMSSKHAWWYECLEDGGFWATATIHPERYPGADGYEVDSDALFAHYAQALKLGDNRTSVGFKAGLSRFLSTVLPKNFPDVYQHSDGKRVWVLPSLEISRKCFERLFGTEWRWPDMPERPVGDEPPF